MTTYCEIALIEYYLQPNFIPVRQMFCGWATRWIVRNSDQSTKLRNQLKTEANKLEKCNKRSRNLWKRLSTVRKISTEDAFY